MYKVMVRRVLELNYIVEVDDPNDPSTIANQEGTKSLPQVIAEINDRWNDGSGPYCDFMADENPQPGGAEFQSFVRVGVV